MLRGRSFKIHAMFFSCTNLFSLSLIYRLVDPVLPHSDTPVMPLAHLWAKTVPKQIICTVHMLYML